MISLPADLIIDLLTLDETRPQMEAALRGEWPAFQQRMLAIIEKMGAATDPDALALAGVELFRLWHNEPRVWPIVQPVRLRLLQARGSFTLIPRPKYVGPGFPTDPEDLANAMRVAATSGLTQEQRKKCEESIGLQEPPTPPGQQGLKGRS
jgi:hypothetical protein